MPNSNVKFLSLLDSDLPNTDDEDVGISYLLNKYDLKKFLTPDDVKVFMKDLALPLFTDAELHQKMRAVGASARGFEKLNDFFAFIQKECKNVENPLDAFRVFDRKEGGFIDEYQMRKILTDMGEGLQAEDIDKCIEMADLYGDGAINYEKVLSQVEEFQYDPLKAREEYTRPKVI